MDKKRDVEANCRTHGIGLIVFADPLLQASYEVLLAPVRKTPHPYDVDEYLSLRLKKPDLAALKKGIRELEARVS